MQIELKNIKIYEALSQETIAFTASLYINGIRVGKASNTGEQAWGSSYSPNSHKGKELIKQAEKYCRELPPDIYPDAGAKKGRLLIPMTLQNFIDKAIDTHVKKIDREKFYKKMNKHQEDSILFGIPDKQYLRFRFKKPISEILKFASGREAIKCCIQDKIHPQLKEGEKILNTNLPPDILNVERKRNTKPNVKIDNPPGKRTGHKR